MKRRHENMGNKNGKERERKCDMKKVNGKKMKKGGVGKEDIMGRERR